MSTPMTVECETTTQRCEGETAVIEPSQDDETMPPQDPPKFQEEISLVH